MPWIVYTPCECPHGGYYVRNTRTSTTVHAPDADAVHQFAADQSGSGARFALGDLVHAATKKFGVPRCGKCAQRQVALNGLFGRRAT